jgi:N-acyl-D-aspartate/D-glutamate deacylase
MRWDWEAFPNTSNSLERGKLGVNAASPIHYSPLHAYAMDNDAARDPKYKATGFNIRAIPARACGT